LCTLNMIPTHNTGQRKDWSTGRKKDLKYFQEDDFQLQFYYYALAHLYPDKNVLLTIFWIRDGGPFTVTFSKDHLPKIEARIRQRFEEIKKCKKPELISPNHKDFKCYKLCHYCKHK